jgi:acetate---CoA ligase (ADP-forming)
MDGRPSLGALFDPDSVAVVGASSSPDKIGNMVLQNLLAAGYRGKIFPVNPRSEEILGLRTFSSLDALPHPPDMAVVCVPPDAAVATVSRLARMHVKAAVVITAGFKETGHDGHLREEELARIAQDSGMALLGPNCLGVINAATGLNASFAAGTPQPGGIAFFSQSGALCVSILDWALGQRIGFSKFISLGNKAVLDESDMLAYLAQDKDTRVLLGYVESIEDGRRFVNIARQTTRTKPVIIIKAGSTPAGAKAASSHTGAIAGSDQAYSAAFRQAGILRAPDVATLFDLALAFSLQPLPQGANLAVVTNSGGPGILTADACAETGLNLARPSPAGIEKLRAKLPPNASLYNPIDLIGDAGDDRYAHALETVLEDDVFHSVLVLLTPTASARPEATARVIAACAEKSSKPVFTCFMGDRDVSSAREILRDTGIPCHAYPEPAVRAMDAMYRYKERKDLPPPVEACRLRDLTSARRVVDKTLSLGITEMVEFQAQELVRAYHLPLPPTHLARTSQEAVDAADAIGYPVVIKIASPAISHKSDVGGVAVGLSNSDQVREAFQRVTRRVRRTIEGAFISGCLVQKMASKDSKEIFVGCIRDPQFGPMVLFGLGGIYVEVLKDISYRLAPLSLDDAREMMREVRSFPVLRGVRGEPPIHFQAVEDILLTMSQMAMDFPEISEAEFNPVLVNDKEALIADARVILNQK